MQHMQVELVQSESYLSTLAEACREADPAHFVSYTLKSCKSSFLFISDSKPQWLPRRDFAIFLVQAIKLTGLEVPLTDGPLTVA